jgi:coenzyme F420-0:L-glutamate ligase/coenzyme F420-1:gamma-L-glutamate ligase
MIELLPLPGLPEIRPGTVLAPLLVEAAVAAGRPLAPGDCLVVTQKVVSKAEGRLVELDPTDLDARRRLVEEESVRILRRRADLIISETRHGLVDVAIGVAGLAAVVDLRGTEDSRGRALQVTEVAIADEVASAAELVMGKARGIPAALVRGLDAAWLRDASVRELIRPPRDDLFR